MVYHGNIRGYKAAVNYLYSQTNYEHHRPSKYNTKTFSLDKMKRLLFKIGNPHKKFKSVHIAGTKGKGSTATMLARMLESCGYKIGLFTSPHISCVRERITINEKKIPRKYLAESIAELAVVADKMKDKPTFFEIMTAIAFKYFCESKVDFAVLETGLGGRLDSTNVVEPEVCGITGISLDHMRELGNNIESIAREKAGILKPGVPAVSVPQHPEASKVLKSTANETKTKIHFIGEDIDFNSRVESSKELGCHTRLSIATTNGVYEHLAVPLPGEHQAENCGLALSLLDQLKKQGIRINDQEAIAGLARTTMPGRMEMISDDPRILVDGAHNAASIKALVKSIGQRVHYDSMVMIVGCAADKDLHGMMKQVGTGADKAIFTQVTDNPRVADPKMLAEIYSEMSDGRTGQVSGNLTEALEMARRATSHTDLICICGSFYLVAEAKELVGHTVEV